MAAKNKAKYEVQVDIDVKTGKVDTEALLTSVSKRLSNVLASLPVDKVDVPVEFDTTKLFTELDKVAAATSKRMRTQIKNLQSHSKLEDSALTENIKKLQLKREQSAAHNIALQAKVTRITTDAAKTATSLQIGELRRLEGAVVSSSRLLQGLGEGLSEGNLKVEGLTKATTSGYGFAKSLEEASTASKETYNSLDRLDKKLLGVSRSFKNAFGQSTLPSEQGDKNRAALDQTALDEEVRKKANRSRLEEERLARESLANRAAFVEKTNLNKELAAQEERDAKDKSAREKELARLRERNAQKRRNELAQEVQANKKANRAKAAQKREAEEASSPAVSEREKKGLLALDKAVDEVKRSYEALANAKSRAETSKRSGNAAEVISSLNGQRAATLRAISSVEGLIKAEGVLSKSTLKSSRDLKSLNKQAKNLERGLRGPTKTMLEFAQSFKTFIRFALAFRVLGGITRGIGALTSNVVDLDDALVSIKAIANATAEEMVSVENAVKNVATTTQFTTTEIAQGAQILAQAGVGPESIAKTLSAVANFAAATNASLTVAADIISTIKNVYQDLDPEDIADKLTNAVNISKLTATGLQTIFSRLAQTAKSFKLSLDQVLGAAAVLKNVGIKDSTISTGFRQGLLELLSPDTKTLKVLEKRYAAVGQNMSKAAISSLFSSFKEDSNPLLRVMSELEKLGIQGSGADDFERLFDVRASNVINALIDNKEQFIKNTAAIGKTGAAARGAKTQLESLAKSSSNLVAVVSTLASDLSGPLVSGLKDVVDWGTKAANTLRDVFLAQKEVTGSSGVGVSLELGAAAGAAAATKGLGAPKAAVVGLLTSAIATAVNSNAGKAQGATASITSAVATLLEIVTTIGVFKAIFPAKAVAALADTQARFAKNAPTAKGLMVGALKALSFGMSKASLLVGGVIAAVTTLAGLLADSLDSDLVDTLNNISAKRSAIGKRLEDDKAALAASLKEVEAAEKAIQNTEKASLGDQRISTSMAVLAKTAMDASTGTTEAIEEILSKRASGIKDVASDAFAVIHSEINQELADIGVQPLPKHKTASLLNLLNNKVVEAEGRRLLFIENIAAAYADATEPDNQEFIKVWEALTQEERSAYQTKIANNKEATAFLKMLSDTNEREGPAELIRAYKDRDEKQQALDKTEKENIETYSAAISAAQASAERSTFAAAIDESLILLKSPTKLLGQLWETLTLSSKSVVAKGEESIKEAETALEKETGVAKGLLVTAIESGSTSYVHLLAQMLINTHKITLEAGEEAIRKSLDNVNAVARKKIQEEINKLDLSARSVKEVTPLADTTTKDVKFSGKAEAADREDAIATEAGITKSLREILVKQKEAVGREEKFAALGKLRVAKETELESVQSRILDIAHASEQDAKKLQQLKSSFVFEEEVVKDLTKKIQAAKTSELRDEELFKALLTQRIEVERAMLVSQKEALTAQIKNALIGGGAPAAEGASLETILANVSKSGILVEEEFSGLAKLVKETIDVQGRLARAEEEYTSDLDNYLRKDLTTKLGKSETKLTSQHNKTLKLEGKLSKASDKLTVARDKLAEVYDKEAEDATFFRDLDREIEGEDANQKGDAKDLNEQARGASTTDEAVSLAKEAGTLAASMLSDGVLTRREARKVAKDSKDIVERARAQEKAEAREEVERRERELRDLAKQHSESLNSEQALQGSVDRLKTAIDNLPSKIAAAMQSRESAQSNRDTTANPNPNPNPNPVTRVALDPAQAAIYKSNADKAEAARLASIQTRAAEESKETLQEGGRSVKEGGEEMRVATNGLQAASSGMGVAGNKLAGSADKLVYAAGVLVNSAGNSFSGGVVPAGTAKGTGEGTTSFLGDLGANTASVAAGDLYRSTEGQSNIVSAYDSGSISRASAERLLSTLKQSLNPSVIQGLSTGGLISGPGSTTDDGAGLFALSDKEFVQPANATQKYGVDFMEQLRSLKFSSGQVRALSAGSSAGTAIGSNATSGADAVATALGVSASSGSSLRPVTLNVGGASFSSQAADSDIGSFRKSLAMQALKTGTK